MFRDLLLCMFTIPSDSFFSSNSDGLFRFDYLLISHFLLNLQDISIMTSDGSDPSRPSFICSNPRQLSSICFADSIVPSMGAPLRDRSHEDEDNDDIAADDGAILEVVRNDEEIHVDELSPGIAMDTKEENIAGPSRIRAMGNITGRSRISSLENLAGPSQISVMVSDHLR